MIRIPTKARAGLVALVACACSLMSAAQLQAAPYAAHVMDARSGETLFAENADAKLHPASLTKMMTLYMAFTAIESGKVRLDSKFTVSRNAANEAPSRLGLKPGQKIELRYLIRAAAIKSANDAATSIGENLSGSEEKFAAQMNAMAKAIGMRNTHFKNANGLTEQGHYSTARDMSTLGRRLFYDFPQYYNIFSRQHAEANGVQLNHTNRKFLQSYKGADGIKTGYTVAAGFNLTASAERDGRRIIATVFGGKSTPQRNQKVAELLDIGFAKVGVGPVKKFPSSDLVAAKKVTRKASPAVIASVKPSPRPAQAASVVRMEDINRAVAKAQAAQRPARRPRIEAAIKRPAVVSTKNSAAAAASSRPAARPEGDMPEIDIGALEVSQRPPPRPPLRFDM